MLRIGIAGIGNMGSAHAIQLAEGRVAGACLAAVCDCSPERLVWAGQRFGPDLARYIDYSQMLAEGGLDAVLIATPHRLHPPMLSAAAPSDPQTSLSGTELLPPGAAVRENLSGEYQDRWKVNW